MRDYIYHLYGIKSKQLGTRYIYLQSITTEPEANDIAQQLQNTSVEQGGYEDVIIVERYLNISPPRFLDQMSMIVISEE